MFIMYLGQCKRSSCRRLRLFSPWTNLTICCVFIMYLGQCKRSSCRRPRVFSPRTGQLQEYCSIKCKNIDTTRAGNIHITYYSALCDILYKCPRNTFTYLLTYINCVLEIASVFYIALNLVTCHPILPILGRDIPKGIWNKSPMSNVKNIYRQHCMSIVRIGGTSLLQECAVLCSKSITHISPCCQLVTDLLWTC